MKVAAVLLSTVLAGCATGRGVPGSRPATPGAAAAAPSGDCSMPSRDSAWLASALNAWDYTRERVLRLPRQPLPHLLLFDQSCVYRVEVGDSLAIAGRAHFGSILLPDGRAIPARSVGLTAPTAGDSSLFLVLSLLDVWRSDPRYSGTREGWEAYLTGAFIHEMTHARMVRPLLPLLREYAIDTYPDTVGDDVVQDRFGRDPGFAAAVRRETDLLFRAVTARNAVTRLALAREALALIRARRARYYVGDLARWAEIEQAFLDLEGVAQWAAFMHARATVYRYLVFEEALRKFRTGEEYWSQDQGLALFLLLNALEPAWRPHIFSASPPPTSSLELLARALETRR